MYYEINVSKGIKANQFSRGLTYYHYFATAPRSLQSEKETKETKEMLKHFQVIFPKPEYKISLSMNPEVEQDLDIEDFLNDTL